MLADTIAVTHSTPATDEWDYHDGGRHYDVFREFFAAPVVAMRTHRTKREALHHTPLQQGLVDGTWCPISRITNTIFINGEARAFLLVH